MAVYDIGTRQNLLADDQDTFDLPLLVPGKLVQWRVSIRDANNAPQSLTNAKLVLTFRENPQSGTVLLERVTDAAITGSTFKQIEHDADQSAEDTSDPDDPTGRSWCTITFDEAEEELLRSIAGVVHHDLTAQWSPENKPILVLLGQTEITLNVTLAEQFD